MEAYDIGFILVGVVARVFLVAARAAVPLHWPVVDFFLLFSLLFRWVAGVVGLYL